MRRLLFFVLAIFYAWSKVGFASAAVKSIHTVFTAECDSYFNWQSIGLYHSFKLSGQPGPITRIVSCTEEQRQAYKDIDVGVPTHFAPSWSTHPVTGDMYSGINKPVAVRDWLQKAQPLEDIILIIDDDTIMRRPLYPEKLGVKPGWAVAGFYGYMNGVANEMAEKHVANVLPRNDTIAGPLHRRGDQVGGFSIMYKNDLARMADDWVKVTEDVRADPDAWKTSGDVYTPHQGDKPWIAEMYGYSFGASKNNIWHKTNDEIMLYPGYTPINASEDLPIVLHYGIKFWVNHVNGKWRFDKHWFRQFDPLKCPPWEDSDAEGRPLSGLFEPPPHPKDILSSGLARFRDLLSIETVATINEALCARHLAVCEPTPYMMESCKKANDLAKAVREAQKKETDKRSLLGLAAACQDEVADCEGWAKVGECEKNPEFMNKRCTKSCGRCALALPKLEGTEERNVGSEGQKSSQKQSTVLVSKSDTEDQKGTVGGENESKGTGVLLVKNQTSIHSDAKVTMNPQEKKELLSNHTMANPSEKKEGQAEQEQNPLDEADSKAAEEGAQSLQATETPQAIQQVGTEAKVEDTPKEVAKAGGGVTVASTEGNKQTEKCADLEQLCKAWAGKGECKKNPLFMLKRCKVSCGLCITGQDKFTSQEELQRIQAQQQEAQSKLDRLTRIQGLTTRCHRAAHFTMSEVTQCVQMAEKDERYEQSIHAKAAGVKKSQPVQESGKTVNTIASDVPTMSKLAVKRFRQAGNTVRRLGENLGEMERDTLDLDRRSLIVLGLLVVIALLVARSCIPWLKLRSTARLKGVRQD